VNLLQLKELFIPWIETVSVLQTSVIRAVKKLNNLTIACRSSRLHGMKKTAYIYHSQGKKGSTFNAVFLDLHNNFLINSRKKTNLSLVPVNEHQQYHSREYQHGNLSNVLSLVGSTISVEHGIFLYVADAYFEFSSSIIFKQK
jgi:hypothetical protein